MKAEDIYLEIAIDRDTQGVPGTPAITEEIFKKIDNASVFIADVSFIDNKSGKRRLPNPNVLIELGYAAKALNWDNIICIFNLEYGNIEELPFDLRHRRPLTFKINDTQDKSRERDKLSKEIVVAISSVLDTQTTKEKILQHIKLQLDAIIFSLLNQVKSIFFGYNQFNDFQQYFEMIQLQEAEINKIFTERESLGFTIFKDWNVKRKRMISLFENPTFSKYITENRLIPLIELSNWLKLLSGNLANKILFIPTGRKCENCEIKKSFSFESDEAYELRIKFKNGVVAKQIDMGIIPKQYMESYSSYFKARSDEIGLLTMLFKGLIKSIDDTITHWDNNILLDPSIIDLH